MGLRKSLLFSHSFHTDFIFSLESREFSSLKVTKLRTMFSYKQTVAQTLICSNYWRHKIPPVTYVPLFLPIIPPIAYLSSGMYDKLESWPG